MRLLDGNMILKYLHLLAISAKTFLKFSLGGLYNISSVFLINILSFIC